MCYWLTGLQFYDLGLLYSHFCRSEGAWSGPSWGHCFGKGHLLTLPFIFLFLFPEAESYQVVWAGLEYL